MKTFIFTLFSVFIFINGISQCSITNITANISNIDSVNQTHTISGQIYFNNPPANGNLVVIEQPSGAIFNISAAPLAPYFSNPCSYSFSNIINDGLQHSVTAYFTDSTSCMNSVFYQAPLIPCTGTTAGPDFSICGLNYLMQGSVPCVGFTGTWTQLTGPGSCIFNNPNSNTSVVVSPFPQVCAFKWEITDGISYFSDTVIIGFSAIPMTNAGPDAITCGNSYVLQAMPSIGTGVWTIVPPYFGTLTPNQADPNATFFPTGGYGTYHLVWNESNGICISSDTVAITFTQASTPYAGPDTTVCGLSYQMQGSVPCVGFTGTWTQLTGPGPCTFSNPNSNTSTLTSSVPQTCSFKWEITDGTDYYSDIVTITFSAVPTPNAGLDFSVCGNFAHIVATQSAGITGGIWSNIGGIAFYDAYNGNLTPSNQFVPDTWIRYIGENDTVPMYWSESNGTCNGYDSVNVYFGTIQPAIHLVDPADSLVCGPTYDLLNAQTPSYGFGHWIDSQQNSTFSPSANNSMPSVTINNGAYGYHDFYWITINGACRDTSEAVPVNFIENPIPNAGGNYWPGIFGPVSHIKTDTVCGLSYQMSAIPSIGTGHWYTTYLNLLFDSTGTTFSPNPIDSLYFPCNGCYSVFNTLGPQYIQFYWQEINNICVETDTFRLYVAPIPSGEFFVTPPNCPQNNFNLIAKTWPLPNNVDFGINSFTWDFPNGILDPVISNPSVSDSIFVSWPGGISHNVSLTTSNIWGCNSAPFAQQIFEPFSGIISGHLTSSPTIDYSAFKINVYQSIANAEAPLVASIPLTSNGNYNFGVPGAGEFYLQAKLVQSDNNVPFANTYYDNQFEWANAQTINLTCNDSVIVNIPLYGYSPATGGQCRIYGLVRYDGTLDPVENATVYMRYQPNQEPARFELTNQNGYYSINNIPNGNYKLFVDIPGLPQVTNHHVLINPNDTVFANVNFIVDTTSISKDYGFGIYADTSSLINVPINNNDFLAISVFPIPFEQHLNLSLTLPSSQTISAELIDLQGRTMIEIPEQKYETGEVDLSFQTSHLESGTYFLKITINNTIYIKKILKVN